MIKQKKKKGRIVVKLLQMGIFKNRTLLKCPIFKYKER